MDQPDLFSPAPADDAPAPARRIKTSASPVSRRTRMLATIFSAAILAVLAVTYWLANRANSGQANGRGALQVPGPNSVRLEVLNGAGGSRVAQRFTDHLRRQGFDVVDMGNARERDIDRTYVIDRSGRPDGAQKVAEALGLPPERVVHEIKKDLMLDVTVVIGRDYGSLRIIPHILGESR